MTAAVQKLICEQGATFAYSITWKDSTGTPINLTGYSARMQVRPAVSSSTLRLELTSANGRISLGGSAGTISLSISAADTAALPAGGYVYDLELVSGATVTRLMQGAFEVRAEVTR